MYHPRELCCCCWCSWFFFRCYSVRLTHDRSLCFQLRFESPHEPNDSHNDSSKHLFLKEAFYVAVATSIHIVYVLRLALLMVCVVVCCHFAKRFVTTFFRQIAICWLVFSSLHQLISAVLLIGGQITIIFTFCHWPIWFLLLSVFTCFVFFPHCSKKVKNLIFHVTI